LTVSGEPRWTSRLKTHPDDELLILTMAIFTTALRLRSVDFRVPSHPSADTAWILLLQRVYGDPTDSGGNQ
jgi:hypothetical protein